VLSHLKKITCCFEAATVRKFISDVVERDWFDGIDFNLAVFHPVSVAYPYSRSMPYANAAGDGTGPNAVA
jgi:hypothetical protein